MIPIIVALIGAIAVILAPWITARKTRDVVRATRQEDSDEHAAFREAVEHRLDNIQADTRATNNLLFLHFNDPHAHGAGVITDGTTAQEAAQVSADGRQGKPRAGA